MAIFLLHMSNKRKECFVALLRFKCVDVTIYHVCIYFCRFFQMKRKENSTTHMERTDLKKDTTAHTMTSFLGQFHPINICRHFVQVVVVDNLTKNLQVIYISYENISINILDEVTYLIKCCVNKNIQNQIYNMACFSLQFFWRLWFYVWRKPPAAGQKHSQRK